MQGWNHKKNFFKSLSPRKHRHTIYSTASPILVCTIRRRLLDANRHQHRISIASVHGEDGQKTCLLYGPHARCLAGVAAATRLNASWAGAGPAVGLSRPVHCTRKATCGDISAGAATHLPEEGGASVRDGHLRPMGRGPFQAKQLDLWLGRLSLQFKENITKRTTS